MSGHPNGSDMATGPYYLTTPLLTSYHQQFWLIAQIVTENKDGILKSFAIHQECFFFSNRIYFVFNSDESFEKKFHVSVVMEGVVEEDEHTSRLVISDHTHNRCLPVLF